MKNNFFSKTVPRPVHDSRSRSSFFFQKLSHVPFTFPNFPQKETRATRAEQEKQEILSLLSKFFF